MLLTSQCKDRMGAPILAILTLTFSQACGSDAVRQGLHRCYEPNGSNQVCVETISQRRSLGDVARGSPGITGRIYGRQGKATLVLSQVSGGPDAPSDWADDRGDPAEYMQGTDFDQVIAALHADAVPPRLEAHRALMLTSLSDLAKFKDSVLPAADPDPAAAVVVPTPAGASQSAGAPAQRYVVDRAVAKLRPRPTLTWSNELTVCVTNQAGSESCAEVVRPQESGSDDALTSRLFVRAADGAETTLVVAPATGRVPRGWALARDDYTACLAQFDCSALEARLADGNSGSAEARRRVARLVGQLRGDGTSAAQSPSLAGSGEDAEEEAWNRLDATPEFDEKGDAATSTGHDDDGGRFFGSMGKTANRGSRPKFGYAGQHYKEVVSVYAEPFLWGIHSGVVTEVFRYEGGVWKPYRSWKSCNHGACPGDKKMAHRFRCAPDVVTYGWYGLDGECENRWGPAAKDHYCNDDTALQINNAFGRWSGAFCAGKHRTHAPRCEMQW